MEYVTKKKHGFQSSQPGMKFVERWCAQTKQNKKKQLYLYKLDSKVEANCGAGYMKQIFQLNTACLRTLMVG